MRIGAARRVAWGLLVFAVVLAGAALVLSALNGERGDLLSGTLFTSTFLAFALTGSLVASRRPDNSIGWLLLGTALGLGIALVSTPIRDLRDPDRSRCAPGRGVGRVGQQLGMGGCNRSHGDVPPPSVPGRSRSSMMGTGLTGAPRSQGPAFRAWPTASTP